METDGRITTCYLARQACEHPTNHQNSNTREPLRTPQANLHPDIELLGRGCSGWRRSGSSGEKSRIGQDAEAALGSLL